MELIEVNPAAKLKRIDKADAYKAWSDEECATFEGSNPSRALLTAYMLGRYTGQRGCDILRWTRAVYDGHTFRFRQSKSERLGRAEMVIPALPPLKVTLMHSRPATPCCSLRHRKGAHMEKLVSGMSSGPP